MLLGLLAMLLATPVDYQPVEDTYIESQLPDGNFGRDPLLFAGPGDVILVRFPGLAWIPTGQEVDTASLTLHLLEEADLRLKSVRALSVPWGEGAGQRAPIVQPKKDSWLKGGATWKRRQGVSKWQSAGAAGSGDSQPLDGVTVAKDGLTVTFNGLGPALRGMANDPLRNFGLRIEFEAKAAFFSSEGAGPGPSLALTTRASTKTGARLCVLSLEPESDSAWTAKVQNIGDGPATGWHAKWSYKGNQLTDSGSQQALAPGDIIQVRAEIPNRPELGEPAKNIVAVTMDGGGQGTTPDAAACLAAPQNGLPVRFELSGPVKAAVDADRGQEPVLRYLQRVVTYVNDGVFPQSRASFAPLGCSERLRLTTQNEPALVVKGDSAGALKGSTFDALVKDLVRAVSPFGGYWAKPPESQPWPDMSIGWIPDTRDDSTWPSELMLPNFPWSAPKPMQTTLPVRGLLGRAEIAAIDALIGKPLSERANYVPTMPKIAILHLEDLGGEPIGGADVDIFPTVGGKLATVPIYKLKTTSSGGALIGQHDGKGLFSDLSPDGSNCWLYVRVSKENVTDTAWFPAWQLASETARGNLGAPTVALQFVMPSAPVRANEDLAQGKAATDSLKRFPAELNAVVDGDPSTTLSVEPGAQPYWLEIDLGRDRLIGSIEIETTGAVWDKFDIMVAKTGQKGGDGVVWVRESAGSLRMLERGQEAGGHKTLTYAANAVRGRYVRFAIGSGPKVDVAAIRVRSLEQ